MLIPNKYSGYVDGVRRYNMDSGGSSSSPTQQSTTVSELPEWAKPYAQKTLAKAETLTDQPFRTYGDTRIAGFSPDQLEAQQRARQMGPASQIGTASGLASAVGLGAMGTQYQPGEFQNQFQAPGQYTPGQFAMMQAQAPQLTQFQMGGPERVRTGSFTRPGTAEAYMSPYIEQAIAPQLREAQRSSDILGTQMAGRAVQQGAFGGSRAGLLEAERERNLATQMGDIRARGLQSAYEQAQNLFGTEQQRALQAALANQQAGLTAGGQNLQALLGVQSLGAQQNLQAQLANQQMLQAAQQAAEQSRQFGAGQGLQAAGLGAQYGQAAQQLGEQSRQFGANLGMQGLTTGLQAAGQLGQLGQTQFGQEMGINQLLNQYGAQQQALRQQGMTQAYQDFLNEQNYPYKQLGFMSDLIRGLPLGQQSAQQIYQAPGSITGQLAGLGVGMYGMSRAFPGMFGGKEGGMVNSYAEGGVTDERNVEDILSKLSDVQLAQAKQAALNARDQSQLQMIEAEMAERASMRRGLGSVPIDFSAYLPDEEAMARGGIVAFADKGLVEDPMFDMIGGSVNPQSVAADRARIEATQAKRAAQEEEDRLKFLKTAAPEVYEKKMAERPQPKAPAKAEPTAKDREIMDKVLADEKAPPAPARAPAKSISEAARIVTDVAKTEVPKDDVNKLFEEIHSKFKSAPTPEAEALAKALERADKRAEEIKARGVGDALMRFGFGMAAGAARPGQARRSGIMGGIEAAAAASPLFAESMAENQKLQAAAEDNALKLRLENARYQSAVDSGNKQLAASLAGSISQRNLQQAQLQAQIDQNAVANELKRQEIAGLAAYRAQAGQTAIQKIADELQADNPKLGRKEALGEASRIAGYSFRTEAGMGGKLAQALNKIEEDFKVLPALMAGNPNSPFTQQMVADRERRRAEAYRLYGGTEQGGVTSGQPPAPGAGQMRLLGVR